MDRGRVLQECRLGAGAASQRVLGRVPCTRWGQSFVPSRQSTGTEWMAVAGGGIDVGTGVLCNEAYAWVVRAHLLGDFCSGCLRKSASLLQCQGCRFVRYCNKTCSALDWKSGGHKRECKHLPSLRSQFLDDSLDEARLLIRTFAGSKRASDCTTSSSSSGSGNCSQLCCGTAHFKSMSQAAGVSELGAKFDGASEQAQCCAVICKAKQVLYSGGVEVSLEELAAALSKFRTNNFGVLDDLFSLVGHGVYPGAALLQHSCTPSCLLVYKGTTLHAIALDSLVAGDELTHSYVDLCQPVRMRQNVLQESHNFICTCARCCEQLLVHSLEPPWQTTEQEQTLVTALCAAAADPLAVRVLLETLPEHTSRPHALVELLLCEAKGPFAYAGYAAVCRAFEAALEAQRLDESAKLCRRIVSFLALTLGHLPFHPLLGLQLFTLGDLCTMVGQKEDAAAFYDWCGEILARTHAADFCGGDLLARLEAARRGLDEE